jgi:ArsR family transcriptional regulator
LWALGDLARLRILRHLPHSENCEHGNNVSQLAEMLGLAQPTVSHHLRVLRQAGLVSNKKMCRDVFYWVNQAEAEAVLRSMRKALCEVPGPQGESTLETSPEVDATIN